MVIAFVVSLVLNVAFVTRWAVDRLRWPRRFRFELSSAQTTRLLALSDDELERLFLRVLRDDPAGKGIAQP